MKWKKLSDEIPIDFSNVLIGRDLNDDGYDHFFIGFFTIHTKRWHVSHYFPNKESSILQMEIISEENDIWCPIPDVEEFQYCENDEDEDDDME